MAEEILEKKPEKPVIKPYILKPRNGYMGKPNDPGSKVKIKAKLSIDSTTGEKIAEPGDKFDLNAEIQSYAGSTDIVSIIARLQNGDESVINVRSDGISGDLVNLPRDINGVQQFQTLNAEARKGFDKLPEDIRALFNNDPSVFFEAVLNNKVDSILSGYKPKEIQQEDEPEGEPDEAHGEGDAQ